MKPSPSWKVKPSERQLEACRDVLKIENRLQMFCYYNTLAWEILAATLASDIALATLPFVVATDLRSTVLLPVIPVCLFLPLGGGYAVYRLRDYAARWVSYPLHDSWEDASTSPRALIDKVEEGNWKMTPPPRAFETYAYLTALLAIVEEVSACLWLSVAAVSLWEIIIVYVVIVLAVLFALIKLWRICHSSEKRSCG
jgi:hypothetical protein